MNALNLIRLVPKIENKILDLLSKRIYEIRLDYAVYKNMDNLRKSIIQSDIQWSYKPNFAEFLKQNKNKTIIIFGSGEWGRYTLEILNHSEFKDIKVIFCDNDNKKWHKKINNVDVISPEEAIKLDNAVIILGSKVNDEKMYQQLIKNGYPAESICRSIDGYTGWQYFDYFQPNESEIFVDGGCFNGKTSLEFTKWASKGYEYIYSFEPNVNMLNTCKEFFAKHELKGEVINKGLWNTKETMNFDGNIASASKIKDDGKNRIETITLDEVLNGRRVTFIKMDIEGAEYKALCGAEKTIQKWRPRLAICVYHKSEDILEIPALLLSIQPDYKFALRQYKLEGGETVLYAY